jgi:hypothetical protein
MLVAPWSGSLLPWEQELTAFKAQPERFPIVANRFRLKGILKVPQIGESSRTIDSRGTNAWSLLR